MAPIILVAFAVAVVIYLAGVVALVGHLLRPRPHDRLLLWFGCFSTIYGIRMFVKPPVGGTLGVPGNLEPWIETSLSYFILIPALLFIEQLYGLGWHRSLRWLTVGTILFAVSAVLVDVATGTPGRVPEPSLGLMALLVAVIVVGTIAGYRPPRFAEWRVLLIGVGIFMLFVLNDHAAAAHLVPWRVTAEPVGFLVQLGCFGYIALTRLVAQGHQLAAVDQEMRSAREIQTAILPHGLPATGRVRIAARYEPLAAVAGDFYDVVALDGGAVAVLVADVSGHGVPAALIASMVKVAFFAGVRETQDPGALLEHMNATLCGMFERSYVTAACAFVHPDAGVVRYALAGHPPPLLFPTRGCDAIRLDERGLFLGLIPSAAYVTAAVPIGPDARLILYTDGVTETPNGDDLFGIERLAALAYAEREQGVDAFADALLGSLRRFANRHALAHDDITFVILEVIEACSPAASLPG